MINELCWERRKLIGAGWRSCIWGGNRSQVSMVRSSAEWATEVLKHKTPVSVLGFSMTSDKYQPVYWWLFFNGHKIVWDEQREVGFGLSDLMAPIKPDSTRLFRVELMPWCGSVNTRTGARMVNGWTLAFMELHPYWVLLMDFKHYKITLWLSSITFF